MADQTVAPDTPPAAGAETPAADDETPLATAPGQRPSGDLESGSGERAVDAFGVEGGHTPAAPGRQRVRRFFGRLFFSTDRRFQMFQTIVGGTIANLIAAGIIAAVAIAAGGLIISFSWSWHFYLEVLRVLVIISIILVPLFAILWHNSPEPGKSKPGWIESAGWGLYLAASQAIFWPFLIAFVDALNISLTHTSNG